MTETIGLVVVAAAMCAIIALFFRGAGAPANGSSGGLFAGYGGTGSLEGFGGGLVASVAGATMLASTDAGGGGAATLGATLGVAYFVLTRLRLTLGIRIVSGAVGTSGFVALVAFFLSGAGCAAIPLSQRIVVLVLILGSGAVGAVASLLLGRPCIPSTLAVFGALKIAIFLSAPLGMSLIVLPVEAWVVASAAAVLLGALSALSPQFVVGVTAAVIGVSSLAVGTLIGDTCSAGPQFADVAAVCGFAAVYLLLRCTIGRRRIRG